MDERIINQKLDQQTKLLEELLAQAEKTRKSLLWIRLLGLLKVILIVSPIILGLIYLPPFVKKLIDDYKTVLPGLEKIEQIIEEQN